jgi:hypothetical protein
MDVPIEFTLLITILKGFQNIYQIGDIKKFMKLSLYISYV